MLDHMIVPSALDLKPPRQLLVHSPGDRCYSLVEARPPQRTKARLQRRVQSSYGSMMVNSCIRVACKAESGRRCVRGEIPQRIEDTTSTLVDAPITSVERCSRSQGVLPNAVLDRQSRGACADTLRAYAARARTCVQVDRLDPNSRDVAKRALLRRSTHDGFLQTAPGRRHSRGGGERVRAAGRRRGVTPRRPRGAGSGADGAGGALIGASIGALLELRRGPRREGATRHAPWRTQRGARSRRRRGGRPWQPRRPVPRC